jgi:predicted nucleotidyltransferase
MDNVDKFLDLFSDFEMIVISKEDRRNRVETKVEPEHKTKADLKKALKRLEREYKHALKSHKINKISKGELYEFEWRIFELQEEIKKMEQRDE